MLITSADSTCNAQFRQTLLYPTWREVLTNSLCRLGLAVGRVVKLRMSQSLGEVVRAISAVEAAIDSSGSTTSGKSQNPPITPDAGGTSSSQKTNRRWLWLGILGLVLTGQVQLETHCTNIPFLTDSTRSLTLVQEACTSNLRVPLLSSTSSANGSANK